MECFIFPIMFTTVTAFITRLPSCRYHARYTVRHGYSYFSAHVNHTVRDVTIKQCSLYCTMYPGCLLFNHKTDNSKCELINSFNGSLEGTPFWQIISTNYSDWRYRGPNCVLIKPDCNYKTHYCMDQCREPGYKCVRLVDLARNKSVSASSRSSEVGKLVDGNQKTEFSTEKEQHPWVTVDLNGTYRTTFITVTASLLNPLNFWIRVGDNVDMWENDICVGPVIQDQGTAHDYVCRDKITTGRYVSVSPSRSDDIGFLTLAEINVYGLK